MDVVIDLQIRVWIGCERISWSYRLTSSIEAPIRARVVLVGKECFLLFPTFGCT